MSLEAVELKISGLVQGVGYRWFCVKAAERLDLTGWARNNPDGTVSVMAEGDRGQLEALIKGLKIGPFAASVRDMRVSWLTYTGNFKTFSVAR